MCECHVYLFEFYVSSFSSLTMAAFYQRLSQEFL